MSNEHKFRLFHVGGREGGIGPAGILFQLGKNLSLSVFEANLTEDSSLEMFDKGMEGYAEQYSIEISIMQQCLSDCVGKKEFYINMEPSCSSLLKVSPLALNYQRMHGEKRIIWGEACQPANTIEIDVTTLDELYNNHIIELPHFLSIDAQGAEYDILVGASKALEDNLVGVITEVEFRELYDNQKLFSDQFTLLRSHQFNLFDLYSQEYWYSSHIIGSGALMVAEALFLRDLNYFIEKDKEPNLLFPNLSKLAIAAFVFGKADYAFQITKYMVENWPEEWRTYIEQSNTEFLYGLMEFYWQFKRRTLNE